MKGLIITAALMTLMAVTAKPGWAGERTDFEAVQAIMDTAAPRIMKKHGIPGLALAVTVDGQRRFYNYGVASKTGGEPVTGETLFEIGSISKTFTALMAAKAQAEGRLSLSGPVSQCLTTLQGGAFDQITLENLATQTSGLPLFLSGEIKTRPHFLKFCADWKPPFPAGAQRVYSNPGIALLGLATAEGTGDTFAGLAEKGLFPELGLTGVYINIPDEKKKDYARGYDKKNNPARLRPNVLAEEAYAVKASTTGLIEYLEAYMGLKELNPELRKALDETMIGRYEVGGMHQALVWEYYKPGAGLTVMLRGGSDDLIYKPNPVTRLPKAGEPDREAVYNKTGSTAGFAGYAVFVPARRTGLVLLSNRPFPIEARVRLAYEVLTVLKAIPAE